MEVINKSIDRLVGSGNDVRELVAEDTKQFGKLEDDIKEHDEKVVEIVEEIQLLEKEKIELEEDLEEVITNHAKAELKLLEVEENRSKVHQQQEERREEIDELTATIAEKERELADIVPRFEAVKQQEQQLKETLDSLENRRNRLELKRGQNSKFTSKSQRDNWLNKEISDVELAIEERNIIIADLETDIAGLDAKYAEITTLITSSRQQLDSLSENHLSSRKEESKLNLEKDKLLDERKNLWREETRLEMGLENAQQKFQKYQQHLSSTMNRNTYIGLKEVEEIAREFQLEGYYGKLADIITVSDHFKLAAERTAGLSLFHVVVDNDETATILVKELARRKAGRVTFMPLNRITAKEHTYPVSDDTRPLISSISYDPIFAPVIKQTFGSMLVCASLEVCNQYMRSHRLDTITFDGDRVDSKGVMTGGYHNPKNSRLDALDNARLAGQEVDKCLNELTKIRNNITIKDQQITQAINQIASISNANLQIHNRARDFEEKIRSLVMEESRIKILLAAKHEDLVERRGNIKSLTDQYDSYKNDLNTPFNANLSTEELKELDDTGDEIRKLKREYQHAVNNRVSIGETRSLIESDLKGNLYVRRDQIKTNNIEFLEESSDNNEVIIHEIQAQVRTFATQKVQLEEKFNSAEATISKLKKSLGKLKDNKLKIEEEQIKLGERIEQLQKDADKEVSKRARLQSRKDILHTKIRSLGTLPDSVKEFTDQDTTTIVERQKVVNEELKQYTHVNKRAAEQYRDSLEKQTHLTVREKELTNALASIKELIKDLDHRKDEAIERTFKEVDEAFTDIFVKLVPDGIGRLRIEKKHHSDGKLEYMGVDIDVSFNSRNNEQQAVGQLSGGQKSLCALTLIFAIQRCDPAPFYLFDEIDANLDTQYRTAVAQMLEEQSKQSQYICTTFRPEMLEVANKFYGVIFKDNMSTIGEIEKENAMSFIVSASQ